MTTLEFLRQNREQIIKIANRYGATNVRVFGSVARGDDDQDSDIDFLVDDIKFIKGLERVDLKSDLEDFLNKPVDVVIAHNLTGYRQERINLEATVL